MPELVRYRSKVTQSRIFGVRYQTGPMHAGMLMPMLVSQMPMPRALVILLYPAVRKTELITGDLLRISGHRSDQKKTVYIESMRPLLGFLLIMKGRASFANDESTSQSKSRKTQPKYKIHVQQKSLLQDYNIDQQYPTCVSNSPNDNQIGFKYCTNKFRFLIYSEKRDYLKITSEQLIETYPPINFQRFY